MSKSLPRDFIRIAYDYATDVVHGRILACKFNVQACQRFLDDIERDDIEMRPKKAQSICMFIEKLRHIKGKWAGRYIALEPWQVFILVNVFGWYYKDGRRRFKNVYLEIPRKNAKSTLSSGVALYLVGLDGEGGAEVYSAATTRDQAKIVFNDAKRMVDRDKDMREFTGLGSSAHAVTHENTSSLFKAVSADAGTLDGLNVHGAIIDEYHAHKTREVVEVLETGTGARENPLMWKITTAGDNIAGVCYEERDYAVKVLRRTVVDEATDSTFTMIFTVDEGDDWKDENSWRKANPNYGISVNPNDLRLKAKKASETPGKKAGFLTKHLNVWVASANAWIDIEKWSKCVYPDIDWDEFAPDPCWIGLDLASRKDIAALQLLFRRDGRWYTFGRYYIPKDRLDDDGNAMYEAWVDEGHLIATEGNVTDFTRIQADIEDFCRQFDVQNVAYDPYQATKLVNELTEQGIPCIEVKQTYLVLSEPMKEVEAQILSEGIVQDGNPCMAWMMSNVVEHKDGKDNVRPDKEKQDKKIDGPVALIMAFAVAMRDEYGGSVYEKRRSLFA